VTIDYSAIKSRLIPAVRHAYNCRDTIIYNLGVGANAIDTANEADLTRVWEERLEALPTMVAAMAWEPYWYSDPDVGLGWQNSVHGEQSIEWHAAVPVEGEVVGQASVEEIYDKGSGRGALMVMRRELTDAKNGKRLATIRQGVFFRQNGGFGGPAGGPKSRPVPEAEPDLRQSLTSRPEQALLYRLSGDRFPLHIDPTFARAGGFDSPILHGLCTYGFAGRALVEQLCGGDGTKLRQMDCRFSAPVIPGETIEILIWRLASGECAFRCRVGERIVIDNGYARFD